MRTNCGGCSVGQCGGQSVVCTGPEVSKYEGEDSYCQGRSVVYSGEELTNHGGYCVGDESVVESGDNCIK